MNTLRTAIVGPVLVAATLATLWIGLGARLAGAAEPPVGGPMQPVLRTMRCDGKGPLKRPTIAPCKRTPTAPKAKGGK
jgi:hypothetical protein